MGFSSEQCLKCKLRHNLHPYSLVLILFCIDCQQPDTLVENLSRTTVISKTGCWDFTSRIYRIMKSIVPLFTGIDWVAISVGSAPGLSSIVLTLVWSTDCALFFCSWGSVCIQIGWHRQLGCLFAMGPGKIRRWEKTKLRIVPCMWEFCCPSAEIWTLNNKRRYQ